MLEQKVLPIAFLFLSFIFTSLLCAEELYIYYPTTMQPNVVQSKIGALAPGVNVTVFGKYRDFSKKVISDNPDAILTKSEVLKSLAGYSKKLSATDGGSAKERYVILSVDAKVDPSTITETTVIGVVDFLSRKNMNGFVKALLGKKSKVKHVTKVADLLPLLTFKMAQAVVIPERNVAYFKKKSKLNFVVTPLTTNKDIAVFASLADGGSASEVAKKLTKTLPGFIGGSIQWK